MAGIVSDLRASAAYHRLDRAVTQAPQTLSWVLVAGVCIVALLSALFVALTPAGSQTELTARTYDEFAARNPEVASLFSMQLVLVGVIAAAFSLLALIIVLIPYRAGRRWARTTLWLVPLAFGIVAVRMLDDAYQVGWYYLLLAIVALVGLLIPASRARRFSRG